MAVFVLLRLMKQGCLALPVHDSFIVPAQKKGELAEAMEASLHASKIIRNNSTESAGYSKKVPHKGAPLLMIVLPPSPQLDLFDAPLVAVPIAELTSWNVGLAPANVRRGLSHEIRRRGLRQVDAACQLGISRPQLSNVLRGRSGVGREHAESIKKFLYANATDLKNITSHLA
jgi:hypothetical protein